jgi:hypothetical protein
MYVDHKVDARDSPIFSNPELDGRTLKHVYQDVTNPKAPASFPSGMWHFDLKLDAGF